MPSEPAVFDKNWLEITYQPPSAWPHTPGTISGTPNGSRTCSVDGAGVTITLADGTTQEHQNCGVGSEIEFLPNHLTATIFPAGG